MRVLVVDDDEMSVEIIKAGLTKAGYEVLIAGSGEEALRILRNGSCRLVLSDWRMPQMSGPDLCRVIRAEKLPGYIYFILLTAQDSAQQKIDGLSAGADDFITKPYDPAELVARVRAGERILTAERAELQAEITLRRLADEELLRHRSILERANADLECSNEKLAGLYQTAQRFVDNVSHEFRTPLTVIKGYAEAISEEIAGPVNARQKEYLSYVIDRTRDLAQMVDDLLDSSKIRAGTLRIDRQPHHISDILAPIRPMLKAKAAGNKIVLEEDIAADLPEVFVDAEKVNRIMVNLVINAIKFSPEGGRVTLWARNFDEDTVEFGITDRGPGISPENLELIFNRFKELGDVQSATAKGFGLGLNIARELVALNLGEIHVKSVTGQGSTFSFTLPRNDPKVVLQRYLEYLRMLPNTESALAMLRIGTVSGNPVDKQLGMFLASTSRPTDLILPAGDDHHHLIVIGCTSQVDRWVDRLRTDCDNYFSRLGSSNLAETVSIEAKGEWPYPLAKDQIWACVLDQLHAEVTYA